MSHTVFLDTSGWLAAVNDRAPSHQAALRAYEEVFRTGGHFVTTNLVVAEMHSLTVKHRGPQIALRLLEELRRDPTHEIRYVDRDLESEAVDRWIQHGGQAAADLTDIVSLEVMRKEGIQTALATDAVFRMAGFRVIPG